MQGRRPGTLPGISARPKAQHAGRDTGPTNWLNVRRQHQTPFPTLPFLQRGWRVVRTARDTAIPIESLAKPARAGRDLVLVTLHRRHADGCGNAWHVWSFISEGLATGVPEPAAESDSRDICRACDRLAHLGWYQRIRPLALAATRQSDGDGKP